MTEAEINEAKSRIEKEYGSRNALLFHLISQLATSKQKCDVCLRGRKPLIDVTIDEDFVMGIIYGAGPKALLDMINNIKVMKGSQIVSTISINDIVVVNPMPDKGFTKDELANVDLSMGDAPAGPNGMALREMIKDAYQCDNAQELDLYLRRFIAS